MFQTAFASMCALWSSFQVPSSASSRYGRIFREDLAHADKVTRTRFNERSWFQRLGERATNLFTRVL